MKTPKVPFVLAALMLQCFCWAQIDSRPLVLGRSGTLHSKALDGDRTINIYLPEGFSPKDTLSYPVIYVLDGGMEEDFVHITGVVRFNAQPWIARFPPSIVVGIEGNTRTLDFTFAVPDLDFLEKEGFKKSAFPSFGGSEKYMDFLEGELLPYVERTYRATGKRTIVGESLAGLLTTEILLKRPDMFDDYIIISPSLWWGEPSLLENAGQLPNEKLKKKVNVYIGAPNREEDVRMFAQAENLFFILKDNENIHPIFDYIPEELHSTVMHQAVYNAFKKMYPKTAYSK